MDPKLGVAELYVRRIKFWADSVEQAHRFGHPPGTDPAPWGLDFQRRASALYRDVLPDQYLEQLASVFLGCSLTMEEKSIPAALAQEWHVVRSYLDNASAAIALELDFDLFPTWDDPTGTNEPTTPAVVRFDLLAAITSAEGPRILGAAADSVWRYLMDEGDKQTPLTGEQIQILGDLSEGLRVADIADARGFSTRSLYRELAQMWDQMGVANKHQGIALAAEHGWLD